MTEDRMTLWRKVFRLTFKAWYAELLLAAWLGRWRTVDGFIAVAAAITASGSAVAGWSVWSDPGWKEIWIALAGTAALASIAHTKLGIGSRIDSLQASWSQFLDIRSDSKTLLDRMDLGLPTEEAAETFFKLQERLKKAEQSVKQSLLEPAYPKKRSTQERVTQELSAYVKGENPDAIATGGA